DEVGDLADELGDMISAKRRVTRFMNARSGPASVQEPRSFYFLKNSGFTGSLSLTHFFEQPLSTFAQSQLAGKTWLVHGSVWDSRHLHGSEQVRNWIQRARESGASLRRTFSQGRECIDCGGEGIYHRLF